MRENIQTNVGMSITLIAILCPLWEGGGEVSTCLCRDVIVLTLFFLLNVETCDIYCDAIFRLCRYLDFGVFSLFFLLLPQELSMQYFDTLENSAELLRHSA